MYIEIESEAQLLALLNARSDIQKVVVQAVDLRVAKTQLLSMRAEGGVFLGCQFDTELLTHVMSTGGTVFPELPDLEFKPYRASLYTADELLDGYVKGNAESLFTTTRDARIYRQFQESKSEHSLVDALAQRLHDHAIDDALDDLLGDPQKPRRVVAIMGGHAMRRGDDAYRDVARMARRLTTKGYFLASGGGPGAMEATNLGAWFGPRPEEELERAIDRLALVPTFRDRGDLSWQDLALEVRDASSGGAESLGVPTWFYGHEPVNVFSTHIAKYFSNSIREDGLLALARHGVIFAPGSAGTVQEVFQDAAQNHYGVFGDVSPMVLYGSRFWKEEKPAWSLLQALSRGRQYEKMIAMEDDVDAIVRFIADHPRVAYQP